MSNISERIKEFVAYCCDDNNSIFAVKIGTSEVNIRNYIAGRHPKFEVLSSIANNFEMNYEWLLTDKGDMLQHYSSIDSDEIQPYETQALSKNEDKDIFELKSYNSNYSEFEISKKFLRL